jgi:4-azaleucine resistance transporter AzlC
MVRLVLRQPVCHALGPGGQCAPCTCCFRFIWSISLTYSRLQGNQAFIMTSNRAEFLDGFRMVLPILIVPTAFSFIVGAASVQKGLSPLEATLMSMGVFAGGGQMLALEVWHEPRAWLLVMLAAVSINVRFALQAASVQRKINHFGFWQRWLAISTLTDPAWGMSEVRHLTRQVTFAFIMGITLPIYLIWAGGTLAGAVLGKLLEDPRVYGLDYAFTVIFIALALPFWKRAGAVLPSRCCRCGCHCCQAGRVFCALCVHRRDGWRRGCLHHGLAQGQGGHR